MVILVGAVEPDSWQFRLGSIFFNTAGEPDEHGCVWTMPEPDGWESPAIRLNAVDIPFGDGQDVGDVYFQARTIHATGEIIAPDATTLEHAKSRLLLATRLLREDGQFIGRDSTGTWYANCRRGDRTVFPNRAGPEATTFDFVLVAGDPHKYAITPTVVQVESTTPVTGGLLAPLYAPLQASPDVPLDQSTYVSHNLGDLDAPVVLTFTGPLTNPTLIDRISGLRVGLAASIPTGRTVVVDCDARTAYADLTPMYSALRGDPPELLVIPAAGSCSWVLLGQGAGHVLVTHNDTKE